MRIRRVGDSQWVALQNSRTVYPELAQVHCSLLEKEAKAEHARSSSENLELDDGIMILKFPWKTQYQNHLALIRQLHAQGAYPLLRVYALEPTASTPDTCKLIVLTGSMSEAQKASQVYYAPEAESFVDRRFGGDWNAIGAESTSDNVPMAGCRVDVQSFRRRLDEVLRGEYRVERIV